MKAPISLTLASALLALAALPATADDSPSPVTITELPDRLRIKVRGDLFTEYIHRGEDRFFPIFYPVLGPGQTPMTRGYPMEEIEGEDTDHPHHQSLWFGHRDVNGENFWSVRAHGGREPGRTIHRGFREIESDENGAHFVAENAYVTADGETVLTDTRTVRISAVAESDGPRVIDVAIAFHASHGDVTFHDEKDAGMAIRVHSDLQVHRRTEQRKVYADGKGHLVNSEGRRARATWGGRARWVDCWGKVDGSPVGIAILDHPDNPRHPTWWHSRTYGLIAANAFGRSHFEKLDDENAGDYHLPEGETATFRWRFVFHRGDPESAGVDALQRAFAESDG